MLDIGIPPDKVLDLPDTPRLPVPAAAVGEQDPVQVADQGYVQLPGLEGIHRSTQCLPVVDDLLDIGKGRIADLYLWVCLEPQNILKRRPRPLNP